MATIKLKTKPAIGGEEEIIDRSARTIGPIENSVFVRDMISGLVGGGYTNLKEDVAQKNFSQLRQLLGDAKANEIFTKIIIHNQDPRYKALPLEGKISAFYDQQKGDPVVAKARGLGYGVLPGFRTSPNTHLQSLQGQTGLITDPETVKRVGLRIKN